MEKGLEKLKFTERYKIYYDGYLISREDIIKKYVDFLETSFSKKMRSICFALHTGSICFDIMAIFMAAMICILSNTFNVDSFISSLNENEMILYEGKRYRWLGTKIEYNQKYLVFKKDKYNKSGDLIHILPYNKNKNKIQRYNGFSRITDGRGIKETSEVKTEFLSELLKVDIDSVPSNVDVSFVVVMDWTNQLECSKLLKKIKLAYNDGKTIDLLDIVTASYYTDNGNRHIIGRNPSKSDPVLKITGKISTARDLIVSKHGNKTIGLMVLGNRAISKGSSELINLFSRRSLKYIHVSTDINSLSAKELLSNNQDDIELFALTKKFLNKHYNSIREKNRFALELNRQINNILFNSINHIIVKSDSLSEIYRDFWKTTKIIERSDWNQGEKRYFLVNAVSILKLFRTAAFSMRELETAMDNSYVLKPLERLERLKELVQRIDIIPVVNQCKTILFLLEKMYESLRLKCPKSEELLMQLKQATEYKTAIIVPHNYHADVLVKSFGIGQTVKIIPINKIENSEFYDHIIVTGNISNNKFNPLNREIAKKTTVLLYDFEYESFKIQREKEYNFERKLNESMGIFDEDEPDITIESNEEYFDIESNYDWERYIEEQILAGFNSAFRSYSQSGESISDVVAIGRFSNDKYILFSKYYQAVVYDSLNKQVKETQVSDLTRGDQIVFVKRNDYTRNMVDYLYGEFMETYRFPEELRIASKKVLHWKNSLRRLKKEKNLTYGDIAKMLKAQGSILRKSTIRHWLADDSNVVGPRDKKVMHHIAVITRDSEMSKDPEEYNKACRLVRNQRIKILHLIGKAIADKLSGNKPPTDSELEFVYNNVEHLTEILVLESIKKMKEPVSVPSGFVNRPISEVEIGEIMYG